jgi:putative FmdB family regulatory protein
MPTYEYRCDACGHQFERFQSIMAAPIKRCPECGKAKVKRLIGTGAGLIFKGSGFYITDYRDKSYTDKAKADTGSTSSDKSEKSDSKSATETKASDSKSSDSKSSETKPATPAPKPEKKSSKSKKDS